LIKLSFLLCLLQAQSSLCQQAKSTAAKFKIELNQEAYAQLPDTQAFAEVWTLYHGMLYGGPLVDSHYAADS
jgi:hypothetical protein